MLFHRTEQLDIDTKACHSELYDRIQKVHYRVGGRDDKLSLNVKVSLIIRYGFNDEKILKVVITDSSNPLLLFSTEIDSDVYCKLKQKLGLLIDFSQFPQQLINLLEQCGNDDSPISKYTIALEEVHSDPYDIVEGHCILFRVFEMNQFQRLCLIALHMVCGSESEVNAFMARNIQMLKNQLENMQLRLRDAEERAAKAAENMSMKNFEVEKIRAQFSEQLMSAKRNSDEEIADLRRGTEHLKEEYEKKIKKIMREMEEKQKQYHARLEDNLERNKAEISSLKNTISKLEVELAERTEGINKLHNDMRILQDEVLKSENKTTRLESESKDKNMFIVSLKQRISNLEKEKEEKDKTIRKLGSMLEAADSEKTVIKSALKEKMHTIGKQKTNLSILTKDLMKANEIIAKLNEENKQIQAKLTERSKIAFEQEKVIAELQSKISNSEVVSRERCERLKELEEENRKLSALLKASEEIVQQKEEQIRKNERVIGWLNDIVGRQGAKSSANVTSTSSLTTVDSNLVDKKLLQHTTSKGESLKTNAVCKKPLSRNLTMRSK